MNYCIYCQPTLEGPDHPERASGPNPSTKVWKNVMKDHIHVVCPHCGQTNKLLTDKPALSARCGSCHNALFDGHPAIVDGARFEKHKRESDLPILVDVWAPWCGPCRAMGPMFERAAKELEPNVRLLKLNADEDPRTTSELGIAAIPTILLLRGGHIIARSAGAMDTRQIVGWVRSHVAAA
jgi:thioredoxin 2